MSQDLLNHIQDPIVWTGLTQVGAAAVLAALVVLLSRRRGLGLEAELSISFARGFVQIVAVGLVIGGLLTVPVAWSALILLGMVGGATWISRQRGTGLPGVTQVSFLAITVGAGLVIVTMTGAGAIEPTVRSLVPVGSLVIANAMKINGLALNRLKDELRDKRDEIEVGLALGGPPAAVLSRHLRTGVRASLIPVVDSLKSLGWVWIPGVMAGMILGGENPVYAALYQFVIMAMIFAAGGLTSMLTSLLMGRRLMTAAEQLRRIGDDGD
ncbi:putative ABC transport system permease protein [Salinibacter ruber]|uniref:ABC transporter permease n=1 Tax=Salinibacter ruber TaxID=146919 RepID=UPI00216953DA|nr:ABC transporter permease [Salinibacter ruber]MCS3753608.1 putative ABC transport system permease protein [Salinibacter ruber]